MIMKNLRAKIEVLKVAVAAAAPPTARTPTVPARCKNIIEKWKRIREKILEAHQAGITQADALTFDTAGTLWTFETWNEQNGKPIPPVPPEVFKFTISNPYVPTNQYPPAAAQVATQVGPAPQNPANNAAKENLLKCIKELRKCAITRGYKDQRSGKYIRGKSDMLYAAAVCEAIELAKSGCEPYSSAGGARRPVSTTQKRDFFKDQVKRFLEGAISALGPECKPCTRTAAPAGPAQTSPLPTRPTQISPSRQ